MTEEIPTTGVIEFHNFQKLELCEGADGRGWSGGLAAKIIWSPAILD
jgi:hypothetical protein